MQQAAKHAIVAKFRVGQDPGDGEPARPDLPQQGQRLAPFFLKPYGAGIRARRRAASVTQAAGKYSAAPSR